MNFRTTALLILSLTLLSSSLSYAESSSIQHSLVQAEHAIEQHHDDEILKQLEAGLDANTLTTDGQKLLHLAARYGDTQSARLLLKFHADVDGLNALGETPLMIAALEGQQEMVTLLYRYDAAINPNTAWTPLCYAATGGHIAVIDYLIQQGANLDQRCANDISPLMMAIRQNHPDAALYLIDQGANINDQSADGKSIWDWAKIHQQRAVLKRLEQLNVAP